MIEFDTSELTAVISHQLSAAAKVERLLPEIVASNASLIEKVGKAYAPYRRSRDPYDQANGRNSGDEHLRDTIGWAMIDAPGVTAAAIGPEGEYGERVGAWVTYGTRAHEIRPRPDGPGYLAWPARSSEGHDGPRTFRESDIPLFRPVNHPGTDPDDFMLKALEGVLPRFIRDVHALGQNST